MLVWRIIDNWLNSLKIYSYSSFLLLLWVSVVSAYILLHFIKIIKLMGIKLFVIFQYNPFYVHEISSDDLSFFLDFINFIFFFSWFIWLECCKFYLPFQKTTLWFWLFLFLLIFLFCISLIFSLLFSLIFTLLFFFLLPLVVSFSKLLFLL